MKTTFLQDKPVRFLVFRNFVIIFLSIGLILGGTIRLLYKIDSKDHRLKIELEEQAVVALQAGVIGHNFEAIISDLLYLSGQNELLALIDGSPYGSAESVSKEYLAFSRAKGVYDQVRYLNQKGMEITRVNYNNGRPNIVAQDRLQFKGERYYFKDTIRFLKNQIFVSPFDLNIEKGKIEYPFKPMIRFGVPVFDSKGQKSGAVLLNYLGTHMLKSMKETVNLSGKNLMLINADGYWLFSPNPEDEWGFMFKDRKNKKFPAQFQEEWENILGASKTQIHTNNGLFTSETIYPLLKGLNSSSGSSNPYDDSQNALSAKNYYWKIVSHVPVGILKSNMHGLFRNLSFLVTFLLMFIAVLSWFLAQAIVRRKFYHLELFRSANFDQLTGLPNRSLFFERLGQTYKQSLRNEKKFAVLFLDLDGFKAVNDSIGHDGGDELLKIMANRIQTCIRESDTVGRFGGDEFVIILTNIVSKNDVEFVAKKIVKELSRVFTIKAKTQQIGVSIGISIFPDTEKSPDSLIQKADQAMYTAKKEGKNCFRFAVSDQQTSV